MELIGKGFKIRPWQYNDAQSLGENANNALIFNNVRDMFPHPYTFENAQEWIGFNVSTNNQNSTSFTIDVEGKAVGAIGVILQQDVYRTNAEIGYWLGEAYWGKGITTEAVKLMANYAFHHFSHLHRLYAGVFAHNQPSMRVLAKAGFRLEAIHREAVIKNGKILDEYLYALLRTDWERSST